MRIVTILLVIILASKTLRLVAQQPIQTESVYNERTASYDIIVDNQTESSYVLKITFTALENLNCKDGNRSFTKTVYPGKRTLTTLRRKDKSRTTRFRYKQWYHPGKYKPKVKMDFPYTLPLKEGNETTCYEMSYIYDAFGTIEPPKDWYGLTMETKMGDTIYAARKGIVSSVRNKNNNTQKGILYSSEFNGITIEHKDGSIADYQLFQNEGIFVDEGEIVLPGQALGTIGGENYSSGSHLRFSVRYFHEHPKVIDGKISEEVFYWAYVPVQFVTEKGIISIDQHVPYKVIHNEDVLKKELSKKEKKRFQN